jgi:hypothetical protein
MESFVSFDSQIQAAAAQPSRRGILALEQLYRAAVEEGLDNAFREALARVLTSIPRSALLETWGYRLDILVSCI